MNNDDANGPTDTYGEIFQLNTAIVGFTREKIVEVQALAGLHRDVANKYDDIAEMLAQAAATSAQLIGDALIQEMGLGGGEDDEDDD